VIGYADNLLYLFMTVAISIWVTCRLDRTGILVLSGEHMGGRFIIVLLCSVCARACRQNNMGK
jgi:hypothetical protein